MRFIAAVTILTLGLFHSTAQTITVFDTLHAFSSSSGIPPTNPDGSSPKSGLILCGNTLYGTAAYGAFFGCGTVFQINTDGSGFSALYDFTNGFDGSTPIAPLLMANNILYGTASAGGMGYGTVFALDLSDTNFSTLYSFTNGEDGAMPESALILAGNTLYGATSGTSSGSSYGSVFSVNVDGSGFTVLHDFTAPRNSTNSDGFNPSGPLALLGDRLYGVASDGGIHGTGTIFEVSTNTPTFESIYSFAAVSPSLANGSGAYPAGGVVISDSDSTFYGAARYGGSDGYGTIYAIYTNGSGINPIYTFTGLDDYIYPQGPLVLSSNMLYGTTGATIFALATNGQAFTNVFSVDNADHFGPNGGLVLSGQSFYGTTPASGANNNGSVFAISIVPAPVTLSIQQSMDGAILTWSNSSFALQAAPALTGPFTNIPAAASPFTNVVSGAQVFFRLIAQ
jgi:uncharacterized repeat protein (TIGR03803 family)